MLRSLFGQKTEKIPVSKLPQLHTFVDVSVAGRPARSLSVESNGPKNIVTGDAGAQAGTAIFTYQTPAGKFRFATRIVGQRGGLTVYEMPKRIDTLSGVAAGAQKRSAVRMDTIVAGMWRPAKGGKGLGEFAKANLRDISRGGCSVIIDTSMPRGAQMEVKLSLKIGAPPLLLLGEVMRVDLIKTSGKHSHGLKFLGMTGADDQAIMDFINRRQADLRNRGLA